MRKMHWESIKNDAADQAAAAAACAIFIQAKLSFYSLFVWQEQKKDGAWSSFTIVKVDSPE